MATCEFSEFSFGYALTDSLVNAFGSKLGVAPVFPNQIAEGKPGGGYDVKLPLNPVPLFLQFKIPTVLTRNTKGKPDGYLAPYYRMILRTKKPNQHALLLDLETRNALVYYATPLFDRISDLDQGFQSKNVQDKCAFVRPSSIGRLDDKPHHVSYKSGALNYWVYSTPRPIGNRYGFDALLDELRNEASKAKEKEEARPEVVVLEDEEEVAWTNQNRIVLSGIQNWLLENRSRDLYTSYSADKALRELLDRDFHTPTELARNLGYVAQIHYGLTLAFMDASRIS